MKRKLVKVGNSLAVTLPNDLVKGLKLKPGLEVDLTVDSAQEAISVRFPPQYFAQGKVTPEYRRVVEKVLDEYAEAWKRLA